jgi:hypothetical protein
VTVMPLGSVASTAVSCLAPRETNVRIRVRFPARHAQQTASRANVTLTTLSDHLNANRRSTRAELSANGQPLS